MILYPNLESDKALALGQPHSSEQVATLSSSKAKRRKTAQKARETITSFYSSVREWNYKPSSQIRTGHFYVEVSTYDDKFSEFKTTLFEKLKAHKQFYSQVERTATGELRTTTPRKRLLLQSCTDVCIQTKGENYHTFVRIYEVIKIKVAKNENNTKLILEDTKPLNTNVNYERLEDGEKCQKKRQSKFIYSEMPKGGGVKTPSSVKGNVARNLYYSQFFKPETKKVISDEKNKRSMSETLANIVDENLDELETQEGMKILKQLLGFTDFTAWLSETLPGYDGETDPQNMTKEFLQVLIQHTLRSYHLAHVIDRCNGGKDKKHHIVATTDACNQLMAILSNQTNPKLSSLFETWIITTSKPSMMVNRDPMVEDHNYSNVAERIDMEVTTEDKSFGYSLSIPGVGHMFASNTVDLVISASAETARELKMC